MLINIGKKIVKFEFKEEVGLIAEDTKKILIAYSDDLGEKEEILKFEQTGDILKIDKYMPLSENNLLKKEILRHVTYYLPLKETPELVISRNLINVDRLFIKLVLRKGQEKNYFIKIYNLKVIIDDKEILLNNNDMIGFEVAKAVISRSNIEEVTLANININNNIINIFNNDTYIKIMDYIKNIVNDTMDIESDWIEINL